MMSTTVRKNVTTQVIEPTANGKRKATPIVPGCKRKNSQRKNDTIQEVIKPTKDTIQEVIKPTKDTIQVTKPAAKASLDGLSRKQRLDQKRKANRVANDNTKKAGSIDHKRIDHRKVHGQDSLATENYKKGENTCVPDALFNAKILKHGADNRPPGLSKDEYRTGMMPSDGTDPSLTDAKKVLEREGLELKPRYELNSNMIALLNVREGHHVVKIVLTHNDDRKDDHHFIAYDAPSGQLIDNYKYSKIIEAEDSDRNSTELALLCFRKLFREYGASIEITAVYELTYKK